MADQLPFPVSSESAEEGPWLSVSDLMSGLMMIFLAIAVFYMIRVEEDRRAVIEVAEAYQDVRSEIFDALDEEFSNELDGWGATIREADLSIQFTPPWVLFEEGQAEVTPRFREVLDAFFPRYIAVLTRPEFKDRVVEVRIEGHTSSTWNREATPDEAYLHNMQLSQARTRAVLAHAMFLEGVHEHWEDWLKARLTANGLSSSHLAVDGTGQEDPRMSRRVEFRVVTNADEALRGILDKHQAFSP